MSRLQCQKHISKVFYSLLLIFAIILNLAACSVTTVKAENLMDGITPKGVNEKKADDKFINHIAEFSVDLFKNSQAENNNALVSPLSVLLALAMTANGAGKETLAQMEEVLGGDILLHDLNEYLYTYVSHLPSDEKYKIKIGNSIWFRDNDERLSVNADFLQTNADYYNAGAYKSSFEEQTIRDINLWVKENTDGLIESILDNINSDAVMYLINAIIFDAKWRNVYSKNDVYQGDFTAMDGKKQTAEFMYSEESFYLEDEMATGFMKPYANSKYCFVALLPNENITMNDYVASLTGERFLNLVKGASLMSVHATMPKFSYDYTFIMNDALKAMGMTAAFSPIDANFKKLGKSSAGNICIGEVLHKAFISVDELGTKAGAVTKVEMKDTAAALDLKTVRLDRPFLYAIIDNSTKLPVFIGNLMSLKD
jgi:serpin B